MKLFTTMSEALEAAGVSMERFTRGLEKTREAFAHFNTATRRQALDRFWSRTYGYGNTETDGGTSDG